MLNTLHHSYFEGYAQTLSYVYENEETHQIHIEKKIQKISILFELSVV